MALLGIRLAKNLSQALETIIMPIVQCNQLQLEYDLAFLTKVKIILKKIQGQERMATSSLEPRDTMWLQSILTAQTPQKYRQVQGMDHCYHIKLLKSVQVNVKGS